MKGGLGAGGWIGALNLDSYFLSVGNYNRGCNDDQNMSSRADCQWKDVSKASECDLTWARVRVEEVWRRGAGTPEEGHSACPKGGQAELTDSLQSARGRKMERAPVAKGTAKAEAGSCEMSWCC